ncbi:MAG: hypothetical protein RI947_1477 [Candidatus Parcubacteria bacterium]|jgi:UDP-N-acetylmuramate--alanine ligase
MKILNNAKKIFIVGIKGVAMSNLAILLKKLGKDVSGSDIADIFPTDAALLEHEIPVTTDFLPAHLPDCDLVIYSGGHNGNKNPQVIEALNRSIAVYPQIEIFQDIMSEFHTSIAVCGCHGKTTASSLLSYALSRLKQQPSYVVGATGFTGYPAVEIRGDRREYFVLEADEYAISPPQDKTPKLLKLFPNYALALNIDFDHPDVYDSLDNTKETFHKFFAENVKTKEGGKIYACADDSNLMSVIQKMPYETYRTYGFNPNADLIISRMSAVESHTTFDLIYKNQPYGSFETSLFGQKNISNVAGVILCLMGLGFRMEEIREAVQGFTGSDRRFQYIASENDCWLFDDYAHHPEEIKATISAARVRFPGRRIIIAFQPHTYSRTEAMKEEFVSALGKADQSLVAPTFASARQDAAVKEIPWKEIAAHKHIETLETYTTHDDLLTKLKAILKRGDIVFTMGAGDIYKAKDDIIKLIKSL